MPPERVSGPNYLDGRRQNTVLEEMAITPGWRGRTEFNLVLRDATVKVSGTYASASLFTTLRRPPLIGRTLRSEEDQREGYQVAVLSYGLWQRHFHGDTNALGQLLTVDTYGWRS